ncbi:hypothetical protein SNE40_007673 [Patella caerulea]|uniref:non-specific serine/threonine protein kinase n=1 Tax=Patella caerulea TaxID=87958 RepID=A0AAN8JZH1_PATCE
MKKSFNPITQAIIHLHETTNPSSLQAQCRRSILQSVTLKRMNEALNKLPLPNRIAAKVSTMHLNDFVIDPDMLNGENHLTHTYPATCLVVDSDVILKVQPKGCSIDVSHPSYLTMFEEGDTQFIIYAKTETLQDVILRCKADNTTFQEDFIWKVLGAICYHVLTKHPSPTGHLTTSNVHFTDTGSIFIEINDQEEDQEVTNVDMGAAAAVYDAPEVITRNDPDEKAFSWSIGCIIYELLALEPAFYDREGFNPFAVIMSIMEGEMPPPPPVNSFPYITDLMWQCLKTEPADRPSVQNIHAEAEEFNNR